MVGLQVDHFEGLYGETEEVSLLEEYFFLPGDGAGLLSRGADHDEADVVVEFDDFEVVYSVGVNALKRDLHFFEEAACSTRDVVQEHFLRF